MKTMTIQINEKTYMNLELEKIKTNRIRNYLFKYEIYDKKESISGTIGSFSIIEFPFFNLCLGSNFLESIYMKSPKTEKIYSIIINEKWNICCAIGKYKKIIVKTTAGL